MSNAFLWRLNKIKQLNTENKNFVNANLYSLLVQEESLRVAQETMMETPRGHQRQRLAELSNQLRRGSWKRKAAQGGLHLLDTIWQEKVVQTTVTLILNSIYQPITQGDLREIPHKLATSNTIVQGRIEGISFGAHFQKVSHLLTTRIQDQLFVGLIKELFAGGDLQGPLILALTNIYLQGLHTHLDHIPFFRCHQDFVVGIKGSKAFAEGFATRIAEFLKKECNLRVESKVVDFVKNSVTFLGHRIQKRIPLKGLESVTLSITSEKVVEILCQKGFCDRRGKPQGKRGWITHKDYEIVGMYNLEFHNLFHLHWRQRKRTQLSRIFYILRFSCAHTLAAKHRTSLFKIFTKHGPHLRALYGSSGEKTVQLIKK